jgi:hypothetical protein
MITINENNRSCEFIPEKIEMFNLVGIKIRKGSVSIDKNHESNLWEVFCIIEQEVGKKYSKLTSFEQCKNAVEFRRRVNF